MYIKELADQGEKQNDIVKTYTKILGKLYIQEVSTTIGPVHIVLRRQPYGK